MKGQPKVIRYRGRSLGDLLLVGAWLLSLIVAAGLFLYAGRWLDAWLGTSPYFMFGLCLLAIITTAGSFYEDRSVRRRNAPFRTFRITDRFVILKVRNGALRRRTDRSS